MRQTISIIRFSRWAIHCGGMCSTESSVPAGPLRLARSMELGGGPVTLTRETALPYARDDCADALLATSAKESPA